MDKDSVLRNIQISGGEKGAIERTVKYRRIKIVCYYQNQGKKKISEGRGIIISMVS